MYRTVSTLFLWVALLPLLVSAEEDQAKSDPEQKIAQADKQQSVASLVESTRNSVVTVTVEGRDGRQAGMGTGFVISKTGLIATNLHVIGEARPIRVRFHNGRELPVQEVHASDHNLDLAIIRVSAEDLEPLPLGKTEIVQGTSVVALGNPMGLRHSVVDGIVSGYREIDGRRMIQMAMPIEPGNSGGPLLDLDGNVAGIVTMKSAITANLGFAVRVADLQSLIETPNPVPMERWKTIGSLDPREWTTLFGASWQKRAGRIVVSEAGDGFGGRSLCLANREVPENEFEVGVFVKLDDEAGAAGLVFAADGDQRHFGFYPSGGRLRLTQFNGPTVYSWQILDELASEHYRPDEWNHLKVHVGPDKLRCYVNDQLLIERRVPDLKPGKVGLVKFRQTSAIFKRFELGETVAPTQISLERRDKIAEKINQLTLDDWLPSGAVDGLATDVDASLTVLRERAVQYDEQARRLRQLAGDVHVREVCEELRKALAEDPVDLVHAALLISRLDNPDLEIEVYRKQFDQLSKDIRDKLPENANPQQRLERLNQYLFEQNGFHGSRTNYYHAANSYFDRVLDDREGLPISLSLLYIELARRLELNVEGVGLPGHFVVRHIPDEGESQLIDVFDSGAVLTPEDARRMVTEFSGGEFREEYLEAYTPQEIIGRILRNLQGISQGEEDFEATLRYLEAVVIVEPEVANHRGLRAVLRHQTGRKQAAVEDLDWFLENSPAGIDLNQIRAMRETFSEP